VAGGVEPPAERKLPVPVHREPVDLEPEELEPVPKPVHIDRLLLPIRFARRVDVHPARGPDVEEILQIPKAEREEEPARIGPHLVGPHEAGAVPLAEVPVPDVGLDHNVIVHDEVRGAHHALHPPAPGEGLEEVHVLGEDRQPPIGRCGDSEEGCEPLHVTGAEVGEDEPSLAPDDDVVSSRLDLFLGRALPLHPAGPRPPSLRRRAGRRARASSMNRRVVSPSVPCRRRSPVYTTQPRSVSTA